MHKEIITTHETVYHLEVPYMMGFLLKHEKIARLESKLKINKQKIRALTLSNRIDKFLYNLLLDEYYKVYRKKKR